MEKNKKRRQIEWKEKTAQKLERGKEQQQQ